MIGYSDTAIVYQYLEEILEAKHLYEQKWASQDANLTGVGIGNKSVGSYLTDELSIRIFVRHKIETNKDVSLAKRIPRAIRIGNSVMTCWSGVLSQVGDVSQPVPEELRSEFEEAKRPLPEDATIERVRATWQIVDDGQIYAIQANGDNQLSVYTDFRMPLEFADKFEEGSHQQIPHWLYDELRLYDRTLAEEEYVEIIRKGETWYVNFPPDKKESKAYAIQPTEDALLVYAHYPVLTFEAKVDDLPQRVGESKDIPSDVRRGFKNSAWFLSENVKVEKTQGGWSIFERVEEWEAADGRRQIYTIYDEVEGQAGNKSGVADNKCNVYAVIPTDIEARNFERLDPTVATGVVEEQQEKQAKAVQLCGGIRVTSGEEGKNSGTIAAVVQNRGKTEEAMLLTSSHVLENVKKDDRITIGSAVEATIEEIKDKRTETVEAVAIKVKSTEELEYTSKIQRIGPLTGSAKSTRGMMVRKHGVATGLTYGIIRDVNIDRVRIGSSQATRKFCFNIPVEGVIDLKSNHLSQDELKSKVQEIARNLRVEDIRVVGGIDLIEKGRHWEMRDDKDRTYVVYRYGRWLQVSRGKTEFGKFLGTTSKEPEKRKQQTRRILQRALGSAKNREEIRQKLDEGELPQRLRRMLASRGVELSSNLTVTAGEPSKTAREGARWVVQETDKERSFVVELKRKRLKISVEGTHFAKKRGDKYDLYDETQEPTLSNMIGIVPDFVRNNPSEQTVGRNRRANRNGRDRDGWFFCDHGDSGAIIVNNAQEAVGLLTGLDSTARTYALATPIADVLEALDIELYRDRLAGLDKEIDDVMRDATEIAGRRSSYLLNFGPLVPQVFALDDICCECQGGSGSG